MDSVIVTKSNGENHYCIVKKSQGELNFKMDGQVCSFLLVDQDDECASDTFFRYGQTVYSIGCNVLNFFIGVSYLNGKAYCNAFYIDNGQVVEISELRDYVDEDTSYEGQKAISRPHELFYNDYGGYFFLCRRRNSNSFSVDVSYSHGGKKWVTKTISYTFYNYDVEISFIGYLSRFKSYNNDVLIFGIFTERNLLKNLTYFVMGKISGYNGEVTWYPTTDNYFDYEQPSRIDVVLLNDFALVTNDYIIYSVNLTTMEVSKVTGVESLHGSADVYQIYKDEESNCVIVLVDLYSQKKALFYKTTDGVNFTLLSEAKKRSYTRKVNNVELYGSYLINDDGTTIEYKSFLSQTDTFQNNNAVFQNSLVYDIASELYFFYDGYHLKRTKDFIEFETVENIHIPFIDNGHYLLCCYGINSLTKTTVVN